MRLKRNEEAKLRIQRTFFFFSSSGYSVGKGSESIGKQQETQSTFGDSEAMQWDQLN
jgi:hypothetical protein